MEEKLMQILADYFELNDTYAYNLTRDKRAFSVGTVTIDDFEEFNMDVIADIADFLIKNGVTIAHPTEKGGEEWMAELLKQLFELFVKKRWLKTIDKECDKYNKIKSKLSRQQYVVNSLLAEYKKIYGEDLRTPKERGGENWK